MKNKTKIIFKFVLVVLAIFAISFLLWKPLIILFSNSSELRELILSYGAFAPLAFIILAALQIIVAPIPGQIVGFMGGFLFGPLLGTIYASLGFIVGSFIVFSLSRKFGRPFVEKFVSERHLEWFDKISKEKGQFTLFLIYLLPFFPDDIISYIAGLTNMKMKNLLLISFLGRLPGFIVLSLVGSGFASQNSTFSIVLLISIIAISIIIYLLRNNLERASNVLLNKFK